MSDTWAGRTQIVELKTEIAERALSRWPHSMAASGDLDYLHGGSAIPM